MKIDRRIALIAWICLSIATGCSSAKGPQLSPADGTVTYMGRPLAGATVTFVPEKGPVAMALTDMEGKFQLATGGQRGAVIGTAKVAVSVPILATTEKSSDLDAISKRPENAAEAEAFAKAAEKLQKEYAAKKKSKAAKEPTSTIPDRYSKPDTSRLQQTVNADGNNHFKIELEQ